MRDMVRAGHLACSLMLKEPSQTDGSFAARALCAQSMPCLKLCTHLHGVHCGRAVVCVIGQSVAGKGAGSGTGTCSRRHHHHHRRSAFGQRCACWRGPYPSMSRSQASPVRSPSVFACSGRKSSHTVGGWAGLRVGSHCLTLSHSFSDSGRPAHLICIGDARAVVHGVSNGVLATLCKHPAE